MTKKNDPEKHLPWLRETITNTLDTAKAEATQLEEAVRAVLTAHRLASIDEPIENLRSYSMDSLLVERLALGLVREKTFMTLVDIAAVATGMPEARRAGVAESAEHVRPSPSGPPRDPYVMAVLDAWGLTANQRAAVDTVNILDGGAAVDRRDAEDPINRETPEEHFHKQELKRAYDEAVTKAEPRIHEITVLLMSQLGRVGLPRRDRRFDIADFSDGDAGMRRLVEERLQRIAARSHASRVFREAAERCISDSTILSELRGALHERAAVRHDPQVRLALFQLGVQLDRTPARPFEDLLRRFDSALEDPTLPRDAAL